MGEETTVFEQSTETIFIGADRQISVFDDCDNHVKEHQAMGIMLLWR